MSDPAGADDGFEAAADDGASSQRYRTLAGIVDAGVLQFDADGDVTAVTDDLLDSTGYARDELLDEHIRTLVGGDGWRRIERSLTGRSEAVTDPASIELSVATASGEAVRCELRVGALTDGELAGGVCVVRVEEGADEGSAGEEELLHELRERGRRLSRLIDNVPGMVYRCRNERGWPMEFVSDACREITGYPPEAIERGDVGYGSEVIHEADREAVWDRIQSNVTDREPFSESYRIVTADGETRWVRDRGRGVFDDGTLVAFEGIISDITERKRRERDLEQYRTIVEAMNDGVYVVDEQGQFTRVNDRYVQMTGYDREELLGAHVSLVVDDPAAERAAAIEAAMRDHEAEPPTVETGLERADGSRLPSEATFALLDGTEPERRVGVARDISDRKEYERKLERSNDRLEEFAHAVSHDLKEPLRMVSSYLQLIDERHRDALNEDGEEFLAFAVDGAERMREMIEGLLAYSRVESRGDSFEPVDLDGIVADVRDDLRVRLDESDADLSVGDLPRVAGDPSQLRQLFQNLLENAIEYSGEESPAIRVDAETRSDAETAPSTTECDGAEWVVSVADDGVGIHPDQSDRVFQMFERLGREGDSGAGIGLALCQRIVDRHGGEIWVESTPGEGAAFRFTLPAADAAEDLE